MTFLREENSLDIGENPTLSDGDASQQLVQFLIIPYGQLHIFNIPNKMLSCCKIYLEMPRDDASLFVVTGSVASQLEDLGSQILHDSG